MVASSPAPSEEDGLDRGLRLGLAAFLGGMTVLHVVQHRAAETMVPSWLPGTPSAWNAVATVAEATSSVLLVREDTAEAGGYLAAATMAGVYVSNVEAVRRGGYPGVPGWLGTRAAALARLPIQVPLVAWALRVARTAAGLRV
jgi:uncharacterized membrane protein